VLEATGVPLPPFSVMVASLVDLGMTLGEIRSAVRQAVDGK